MSRKRKHDYSGVAKKLVASGTPTEKKNINFANGVTDKSIYKVPIRTFPIMIGIPMDEVMFSKFFTFFIRNIHPMPWDGFTSTESTYLPDARNVVHKSFYDCEEYPYLFMLDSDVMCPPNTVERLLSHNLPVVAGWYRNKGQHRSKNNNPVVYDFGSDSGQFVEWNQRTVEGTGLEQVGAVGAGCILMKREVAKALGEKPYDMNHGGEDLKLCYKLRQLDIPIFVDWSIDCSHLGVFWA
jgi:hypothetical protein